MLSNPHQTISFDKKNYNPFRPNKKSKSLTSVRQLLTQIEISTKKRQSSQMKREPCLDREEIRKQMKKKWKDPGYCNFEFGNCNILKGRFLNEWQIERICLADRSFRVPKNFKGLKQCFQSREFPKLSKQMHSQKFQKYLSRIEQKNEELMFNSKKIATQISTGTFRGSRYVLPINKQTFQAFSTQNKAFGMGTIVWKKGQAARKLKTLNY